MVLLGWFYTVNLWDRLDFESEDLVRFANFPGVIMQGPWMAARKIKAYQPYFLECFYRVIKLDHQAC